MTSNSDDLDAKTILNFICGDFECSWDAIAHLPALRNRGNFLFAKQAMTLLEVICRICETNQNNFLKLFSQELNNKNTLYFKRFPRPIPCDGKSGKYNPNPLKQFWLPTLDCPPSSEKSKKDAPFIGILFYLIRNGLAHNYQQSLAKIYDDSLAKCTSNIFGISLTGPDHQQYLRKWQEKRTEVQHLSFSEKNGDIWITVHPAILYLDIRDAAQALQIDCNTKFNRKNYSLSISAKALKENAFELNKIKQPTFMQKIIKRLFSIKSH